MKFKSASDVKRWVDNHPIREKFPEWKQNILYVDGQQYWSIENGVGGSDTLRDLTNQKSESRRNLTVRNKMAPAVSVWIGQFLERLAPNFTASPSTEDYDDIQKAKVVEKTCKWFWEAHDFVWNLLPGLYWLSVTGNMIGEVTWDNEKDGELYDDVNRKAVKKYGIGDVNFRCVSPFTFYTDPAYRNPEQGRFVIVKDALPKDVITERWGDDTPTTSLDSDESTPFRYFGDSRWAWPELEEMCILYTTYERSNGKWTKKIWSGDKVVEEEDLTHFPFITAWQRDYGRFYGDNSLRDVIQLQRDKNKIASMTMDHAETLGNIYLTATYGTQFEVEKVADGKIAIIRSNGGDVKTIGGVPTSSAHQYMNQGIDVEIEDSLGTHAMMQGRMPSGSTHIPGYIQRSVMENDVSRMGTSLQLLERFVKGVFMKIVEVAQEKYTVSRLLRINGIENEAEVMDVKGDRLSCADISIDLGSGFPLSKMERLQLVMQMVQTGFVENKQKAMEFLGIPDIDRFFYVQRRDVLRARRENEFIYAMKAQAVSDEEALAMAPQVDLDDDDDVHLGEHRSEKKTTKFEKADPLIRQLMDAHIALHKENQIRKAREDIAMAAQIEAMKAEAAQAVAPQQPQQAPQPPQGQNGMPPDLQGMAGAVPPEAMQAPVPPQMENGAPYGPQNGEIATEDQQAIIEAIMQAQGQEPVPMTPEELILAQAQMDGGMNAAV